MSRRRRKALYGLLSALVTSLVLPFALAENDAGLPAVPATSTAPLVTAAVRKLVDWGASAKARIGVYVVDGATGAVLSAVDEHRLANPASNTKILTAAVALDRLGPDYRFTTALHGSIEGDRVAPLVLRGNGDPSLESTELWQLASALFSRGVRHVDGLLVDQSYFDDAYVPPAFEQQPNEWATFRAPVSAVALDRNAVTLHVFPRRSGSPAAVWFEPPGFVDLQGSVATKKGDGDGVRLSLSGSGARLAASVSGFLGDEAAPRKYSRRVEDPRLLPGQVFATVLREVGIDVTGAVAVGGAGENATIATIVSPPLSTLVRELGKNSDNFYAEMLLKALGGKVGGAPAHSAAGANAVVDWLAEHGALEPGTIVKNGSGLFDANRVSPFTLVNVLRAAYTDPRIGAVFLTQLAIGGVDGTLRNRFRSLAGRRAVHAKTGTLDDVIALSGYVLGPDGRAPVVFAFVAEGVTGHHAEARNRIDRCVEAIAAAHGGP